MSNATEGTPENVHQHTAAVNFGSVLDIPSIPAIPIREIPENHPDLHLPKPVPQENTSNGNSCFARFDNPLIMPLKTELQPYRKELQGPLT